MRIQPGDQCPGKHPGAKSEANRFHGPSLHPVPDILEQIFGGVSAVLNTMVCGSNAFFHSICHD